MPLLLTLILIRMLLGIVYNSFEEISNVPRNISKSSYNKLSFLFTIKIGRPAQVY